jgi:hypothetical protein
LVDYLLFDHEREPVIDQRHLKGGGQRPSTEPPLTLMICPVT